MWACPTGFNSNGEPRRQCILDAAIGVGGVVADFLFNEMDTQWPFMGIPFGRMEGPLLFLKAPVLLPNRGLYFDGHDDFMNLKDIRLNFQMTIHAWVHVFEEEGYLFALDTASPQNHKILGDNELAIKFGVDNGAAVIFGLWDAQESIKASASALLGNWKILAFRFADFDASGSTSLNLWANDELLISHDFIGSNWFHDTILDRPHIFGDSIFANINPLVNNNLEFHLYRAVIRNGLIDIVPSLYPFDVLATLDICKAEGLFK